MARYGSTRLGSTKPAHHALYKTAQWQRLRLAQLSAEPLCEWCRIQEIITEATEVHHKVPHRGDLDLFWSGPFISTCKPCHSSRGQMEDHGKKVVTTGVDGYPIE